jgi:hypothetical protein
MISACRCGGVGHGREELESEQRVWRAGDVALPPVITPIEL